MMMRKGPAFWALVLAMTVSQSAFAQRRNQQEQQKQQLQQQQAQAQQGVGPVAQSKDEADAFTALQREPDPVKKIELADGFVSKFPNSDFVSFAEQMKLVAYGQQGKFREAVLAAEKAIEGTIKFGEKLLARAESDAKLTDKDKENIRKKDKNAFFLDKNSPQFLAFMDQSEQRILAFHQAVLTAYQQLNDAPKMLEWGEKALGIKPDDLNTLAMLSNVMAERPPTNEAEKTKQMKRAEELANQALEALPRFLSSPEAANIPAQAKNDLTAQMHYTLGLIYLHQKKLGSSQQEFVTSIKNKPNDPVTYYRLGIAYVQDMKNDQAMDALGKSVFLKGVSEANSREVLKQLWVNKNKSEQGLEDFIKSSGAKIGQ